MYSQRKIYFIFYVYLQSVFDKIKNSIIYKFKITVQFREGWDKMNFVTLTSDEFNAFTTKHFSHYTQSAIHYNHRVDLKAMCIL